MSEQKQTTRTDNEVICEFMEPSASLDFFPYGEGRQLPMISRGKWWQSWSAGSGIQANPEAFTLDRLREIEERLTEEQQWDYCEAMRKLVGNRSPGAWHYLHASAEAKTQALAEVLRQTR